MDQQKRVFHIVNFPRTARCHEPHNQTVLYCHFVVMPIELTPSSSASELIQNGWFHETEAMWPGQKFSIEVDEVLLNGRSEFQVNINRTLHFVHLFSD